MYWYCARVRAHKNKTGLQSTVPNEKEEDRMCQGLTVQSPESRGRNKNGDQRLVSADDNPTFPPCGINKYSSGKD